MNLSPHIRFFNHFRNIIKWIHIEPLLAFLTHGNGYDYLFVKCIPQNYQYKKETFRIAKRDGIIYRLDLSEYMEWVIYFGLNVEERTGLYPLIKRNMVILDIGTNIGETLLNFAKNTGSGGMVYGFEPVDENFNKCMHNVSLNPFKNIRMSRVALSDNKEILYFGLADNKNSGGIYMKKGKKNDGISVQAITLDEFIEENNINNIDFVKIDVEGFEFNVLKGAEKTIKKLKPVLFVEMDEANLNRQSSSLAGLTDLIISYGYNIRKANGNPLINPGELHYDLVCEYPIH